MVLKLILLRILFWQWERIHLCSSRNSFSRSVLTMPSFTSVATALPRGRGGGGKSSDEPWSKRDGTHDQFG
ncbi:hypothetical protein VNO77_00171 [Canavalia gladiata]|uniref:Secreted protein n=1 Tax=Canavalia gladiata TaxID=3824 RepID=A0AAN9MNV2_CANGL